MKTAIQRTTMCLFAGWLLAGVVFAEGETVLSEKFDRMVMLAKDQVSEMGIRLEVVEEKDGVIKVPKEGLVLADGKAAVFVKDFEFNDIDFPTALFLRCQVDPGDVVGESVVILRGIFPGDEVVVTGVGALEEAYGAVVKQRGISLKEALDLAHGHRHHPDGSEMTAEELAKERAVEEGRPRVLADRPVLLSERQAKEIAAKWKLVEIDEKAGAILISETALVKGGDKTFVFVRDFDLPDHFVCHRLEVKPGAASDGGMVLIEHGLLPGDEILIDGVDRIEAILEKASVETLEAMEKKLQELRDEQAESPDGRELTEEEKKTGEEEAKSERGEGTPDA